MVRISLLLALFWVSIGFISCNKYTIPVTQPLPTEPSGTVTNGNIEEGILANVNTYRRSRGLATLQMSGAANQQAAQHSRNMATGKTGFSHDGFSQRVNNIVSEIGRVSASAENVAFGNLSAKQVVDVWLKSSGHKKNIEGNYNLTGIGVYPDSKGVLYFTQIFLRK
jgi:uncharacterized protein YkwD